ncbi:methyl-accepting chemotaxis protein [Devosia sp. SL43]|uniref:methyl-accepting chemotaxis protein n=1 Tax=Devosia sp. SL43 TaxID=2806348 RepID=UPI001F0024B1|nr:methyl-accepting chemotaxis protein [Devosia sp. SL43]UJW85553.1 PAS domain S-box protein [Devosia sp. SL43]
MGFPLFQRGNTDKSLANADTLAALHKSQGIIEFQPDGTILTANENFLGVVGYTLSEVQGRHHSMFLEPAYAGSADYKEFWAKLVRGEFQRALFKRIGKGGSEVWIEASYNPLLGKDGKVYRVVKIATDVTERHNQSVDARGQIAAISRSQAVIEFSLDGTVLTANQNFCSALGYHLDEIKGQHHRMFVRPQDVASPEYAEFWRSLGRGEFQAAEYLRIGKNGREVWIQASYNPIYDGSGRPYKVVKYATDITARKAAVNELSHVLGLLAEGNLTCHIDGTFPGELDQVRVAFNETVGRFSTIVQELRQTSGALRAATGEILAGANDLAERTTRQAAAIEETSAAVEQLSQAVTSNAKRADTARTTARSVSDGAKVAGDVMGQANDAMEAVTTQASKISNIIGLIDDIAFQTNLLALNASVEAARAGDAGKGFAVVAVEVRRLAQSAASASSDVKGLIEQSSVAVSQGTKLVASATEQLNSMVGRVQENALLMDEIARANGEQASAIAEVNTAIRQMDEMTQHNAALVEETNAAIEQTEGQAGRVDTLIEVFVVDATTSPIVKAKPGQSPRPSKAAAARTYLTDGAAAIAADWNEF